MGKIFMSGYKKQIPFEGDSNINSFVFPAGEIQCSIEGYISTDNQFINVTAYISSAHELLEMCISSEVILRKFKYRSDGQRTIRRLTLPYFPYAQQDRIMKEDESFLRGVPVYWNKIKKEMKSNLKD